MKRYSMAIGLVVFLMVSATGLSQQEKASKANVRILEQFNEALSNSVENVIPAVVNIRGEKKISGGKNPFEGTPFEDLLPWRPGDGKAYSLGSGFIIDGENGYILTNNHVIEGADRITVDYFGPGGPLEFEGEAFPDPKTELALVKIKDLDGVTLPEAELGDSDQIKVGHLVTAIGSPFQKTQSVSIGIISGLGRSEAGPQFEKVIYKDFIQTDAAINQGNSGGPLLNIYGQVIGINTYIYSTSGGAQGVGFAIPVNTAKKILDPLIREGKVTRPFLGITMQSIKDRAKDEMEKLGVTDPDQGVIVQEVVRNSPAEKAGIESFDVLLEFDGDPIMSASGLQSQVLEKGIGDTVEVTLWRPSMQKKMTVEVQLAELPEDPTQMAAGSAKGKEVLGMTLRPVTEQVAEERNLEETKGLLVEEVDEESTAASNGIPPGAIILKAQWQEVNEVEDFREIVEDLREQNEETVILVVLINHTETLVFLDLE